MLTLLNSETYNYHTMEKAVPEIAMPLLSIIIPAYNEEARAAETLKITDKFFSSSLVFQYEIIVVSDGCTDGTNDAVRSSGVKSTLIINDRNAGKGASVRRGIEAASGDFCLVMDMDMPVGLEAAELFLKSIYDGADIAAATRYSAGSEYIGPGFPRALFSRVFNIITRLTLGLPYSDTQCGYKMMRTDVAKRIMKDCTVDRFAYDTEFLYRAHRQGVKIVEIPVKCVNPPESKVRLARDSMEMFRDVLAIKMSGGSVKRGK